MTTKASNDLAYYICATTFSYLTIPWLADMNCFVITYIEKRHIYHNTSCNFDE